MCFCCATTDWKLKEIIIRLTAALQLKVSLAGHARLCCVFNNSGISVLVINEAMTSQCGRSVVQVLVVRVDTGVVTYEAMTP